MHKLGAVCFLIVCSCWLACEAAAQGDDGDSAPSVQAMQSVRISVCQTQCVDDDREGNFTRVEAALRQASAESGEIAVFPETCLLGWVNPNAHQLAHPIPSDRPEHDISRLSKLAKRFGMMICIGLAEKSGEQLHDSVVLIDRDGTLLLKHRKINVLKELMDPPYTQGTTIKTAPTRFGKIGLLICADTFHQECLQEMGRLHPDLVLVPYGWAAEPDQWPGHGPSLLRTVSHAAKTIGAPIVGVDAVGEISHGPWRGRSYGGQSVVCDAEGRGLLGGADRQSQVVTFEMSLPVPSESETADLAKRKPAAADALRVASCQFPVSSDVASNGEWVRKFMRRAKQANAHVLHTSEAALSGYAGVDFTDFDGFDWQTLREQTDQIRQLAKQLNLWVVLGSAHYLDADTKPTNCLYLIDNEGNVADRYDKSMCTGRDQLFYSAGNRLVTREIRGVKVGLAICYDGCWPQIYAAYQQLGVTLMLHSFHNANSGGPNCLDVLVVRQIPTRCADYRMWVVANNSSAPYSHWASFVARPDSTITNQLKQNQPGMLVHDFPDGLSDTGWYHNFGPMRPRDDERFTNGEPSSHPRQIDSTSLP